MNPDIQWRKLSDVMNAFIQTEVLSAACRLRLFDLLTKPSTPSELAQLLEVPEQRLRVLLLGCLQAELIVEQHGRVKNSEMAERFLTSNGDESVINFVDFVHQIQQRTSRALVDSLKSGEPRGLRELGAETGQSLYQWNALDPSREAAFHAAMSEYSRVVAPPELCELETHNYLLDLGGGNGQVSESLTKRHPRLRSTILDLPSVCENAPTRERVEMVPGDVLTGEWPSGADAILLSHFVEIFAPQFVKNIYLRAFSYLPMDGRIFVWTLTAPTDGELTTQSVKSSVYFLTTAGCGGTTYSPEEHISWLNEAGFILERVSPFASTSHTLFVAIKKKENNL